VTTTDKMGKYKEMLLQILAAKLHPTNYMKNINKMLLKIKIKEFHKMIL
jgi:hypothetical protein